MEKIIKCGIVGYGYMGEIRKKVIEQNPRLSLSGICEMNEETKSKIKDAPLFNSFEELLDSDVDVVFVCTPNKYSPELVMRSMKTGKHVFCEKPPGCSLEDIQNIIACEKECPQVKLMFGFNHRYHPAIIYSKKIIESSELGDIINIRGLYGKSGGISFKNSWRNNKEMSGGGILLDQGIHMLDLFCYYCTDFESVKGFTEDSFWKFGVEDNAYVIMKNIREQGGIFHSSSTLWKHTFRLEITLRDGYIHIEGLLSKTGSYGRERIIIGKREFEDKAYSVGNPAEEVIYFDKDNSWNLEVQEFIRCIDSDTRVEMSSSLDALKVMRIIDMVYKDSGVSAI